MISLISPRFCINFSRALLTVIFAAVALTAVSVATAQERVTELLPAAIPYTNSGALVDKVGVESDFVFDSRGHLHIAYRRGANLSDGLFYATNASGEWKALRLDFLPGSPGPESSGRADKLAIDVDQNDVPHIVGVVSGGVVLFTDRSGRWTAQRIESRSTADNTEVSLVIDDRNALHVTYSSRAGQLRYATRTQGQWEFQTVANTGEDRGNLSLYTHSLQVDGNGKAHIGYTSREGDLMYTTNASGSWSTSFLTKAWPKTVAAKTRLWQERDFLVLPGGIYHLLVHNYLCAPCLDFALEYRTNQFGDESPEPVAQALYEYRGRIQSYPISSPSLAVDQATGNVFISFILVFFPNPAARTTERVIFIFEGKKVDGEWTLDVVEENGFESRSTLLDDYPEIRFNRTKLDSAMRPVTTFLNGGVDALAIRYVPPEVPVQNLNMTLLKAALDSRSTPDRPD